MLLIKNASTPTDDIPPEERVYVNLTYICPRYGSNNAFVLNSYIPDFMAFDQYKLVPNTSTSVQYDTRQRKQIDASKLA